MTKSISHLYRAATARATSSLDADAIAALAEGSLDADARDRVAAEIAGSDAEARLVRMLRELAPASEALAEAGRRDVAHRGRRSAEPTVVRHAAAMRARRWPRVALAACAAAVLAVVTLRVAHDDGHGHAGVAQQDRIFSPTSDALAHQAPRESDRLFRSDFRADRVFKTDFNDG